jgi:hypothetical protein
MITHVKSLPPAAKVLKSVFCVNIGWLAGVVLLTLVAPVLPLQAAEPSPDDQYLAVLGEIERADALRESGQADSARTKYREAQDALLKLKKDNPNWNTKVVAFRLNYIAEKLAAMSQPASNSVTGVTNAAVATEVVKPPAKPQPATAPSASVTLISAGNEPRKALRIRAAPGDKQALTMTTKTAMDMVMGEMPAQAMKLPAMTMVMNVTVKSVSADGDIAYETVITDAGVADDPEGNPMIAAAMKSSLAGIKGLSSSGVLSSRGLNKGTEVKVPAGADPQTRQYLDQMKESFSSLSAPFPEEAVGPGAKWEVKLPLKSQGMTIAQTATYELVSIEGDRLNMKASVVQRAANQKIENPSMPGLKMDLTEMNGTGKGTVMFDQAKLLPSSANIDSHTEMVMGMDMGGQKQNMSVKTDMNLRLDSK